MLDVLAARWALAGDLLAQCKTYVFGSVVKQRSNIGDVDILVVYGSDTALASAKLFFEPLEWRVPFHITYLSESEEMQFEFVSQQTAQPLGEILGRTVC